MLMRCAMATLCLVGLLAACEPAAPPAANSSGSIVGAPVAVEPPAAEATQAPAGLSDWTGRYSIERDNGNVEGAKFKTTDTLDIVPVDDSQAFLHAELLFFNGHTCTVVGIAKLEGEALVLRGTEDGLFPGCVLSLTRSDGQLKFSDPEAKCTHSACGARGSLTDYEIPLASRAPYTNAQLAEQRAGDEYLIATGAKPGERQ